MNHRFATVLGLAAVLLAPTLPRAAAAPDYPLNGLLAPPATGCRASAITATSWDTLLQRVDSHLIAPGATQARVRSVMGPPARRLAPNVWLYRGYEPNLAVARDARCNLLVLTFAHRRLASLRFLNQPAESILAANTRIERTKVYANFD